MRSTTYSTWLAAIAAAFVSVQGQTYTKCNPLTSTCSADPALGKTIDIDFTAGESSQFTAVGAPTYDSSGAHFTVAKSGDSPTITSNWYMMFGHVEAVVKTAPGVGIVSTMVLQSDDLDEIDYEWLGADNTQAQSNYFGKGQTLTYNRGAFHPNAGNQDSFHTYTVDWTADQIVWQINGKTVRALSAANAATNQYPQTPMQLKLGVWSAGDPSNAAGTIQWAGGNTKYAAGPYTMTVQSVKATDYSTGKTYTYGDETGDWQSIKSDGGSISGSGGAAAAAISSAAAAAPSVTEVSSGAPMPFDGTHKDSSSSYSTPTVWPWVATATTLQTSASETSVKGLPSGWTVSSSGKVVPPNSASSTSPPASYTSSSHASPADSSAGSSAVVITAAPIPQSTVKAGLTTVPVYGGNATATGSSSPIATGSANNLRTASGLSLFCVALFGVLLL